MEGKASENVGSEIQVKSPTFDSDGYPTEETLKLIEGWDWKDTNGLLRYIKEAWKYDEYIRLETYQDKITGEAKQQLLISTAGWSGNESIMSALKNNTMFWSINWYQSTRGGHYIFRPIGDSQYEL